ncbi:MAG: hypothetical protein OJF49_000931 [Ktedonobacterales bacterium]|jgi:hypothetical protein|nr:MAG: hypothetical protein OJF49_000931 [Ktedonobacterales bacterium]
MYLAIRANLWRIAALSVVLALAAMSACGQGSTARQTPTLPTLPPFATQTLPAHPTPTSLVAHIQPASTQGWAIYHDSTFPFQLPMPPGWRAGSYVDDRNGTSQCEYVVDFFPPGSNGVAMDGAQEKEPELIFLYVKMKCQPFDPHGLASLVADPSPIGLGSTQTTLYVSNLPAADGPVLIALAMLGGHQYQYSLQSTQAKGQEDIALFLGMLRDFRYTGS